MKKKGFTLVELLAVIVILAAILVIAVPATMKIVGQAREKSAVNSFRGYMDAIDKTVMQDDINLTSKLPKQDEDGCYLVDEINPDIKLKGIHPRADDSDDRICMRNGQIVSISEIIVDIYKLEYRDGEIYLNGKNTSVEAESIRITNEEKKAYIGYTLQLQVEVTPENGDLSKMKWASSNEEVATVDENGVVRGISKGEVKITATTRHGKSASINLKVEEKVRSITITNAETEIYEDDELQLNTEIDPPDAITTYTWTSSNPLVAIVSNEGKVIGLTSGTAEITVETGNGKTATKIITVKNPTLSIEVSPDNNTWTNGTKTVTITTPTKRKLQYKRVGTDNEWQNYTSAFTVDQNVKIKARINDGRHEDQEVEADVLKIDKVAPTCELQASGTEGQNGWYRSNIAISFKSASDKAKNAAGNEIEGEIGSQSINTPNITTDGTYTVTGTVTDKAGNSNTCSITVGRDTVNPTMDVTMSGTTQTGYIASGTTQSGYRTGATTTVTCTDDRSGVVSKTNGTTYNSGGTYPEAYTCTDKAGNTATVSKTWYIFVSSQSSVCGYYSCQNSACGTESCSVACGSYVCGSYACGSHSCTVACGTTTCSTTTTGTCYRQECEQRCTNSDGSHDHAGDCVYDHNTSYSSCTQVPYSCTQTTNYSCTKYCDSTCTDYCDSYCTSYCSSTCNKTCATAACGSKTCYHT